MAINLNEHCNLCDNVKSNLQNGITCGLTSQKPSFNKTCSKILLDKKFKNRIGFVHAKIKNLKRNETSAYIYSSLFIIIGVILILSQKKILVELASDFDYIEYKRSAGNILLMFLGFGLIILGFNKLNRYRKKMKTVLDEKKKIDTVLNEYKIKYNCDVTFGNKYHGNKNVIVELKSDSNLLKGFKETYQI
ncbi:MAG: hypothetical protein ACK5M1_04770 [Xanthomarina gelatinilytica]|uniref:hypothetical protein n=1 Tax=Xanthomarina gelatinilytica TaxID=1137281 RepID=UPI003A85DD03